MNLGRVADAILQGVLVGVYSMLAMFGLLGVPIAMALGYLYRERAVIPFLVIACIFAGGALVLGGLTTFGALKIQQEVSRASRGLCVNCGYDLRESRDRCPECGGTLR